MRVIVCLLTELFAEARNAQGEQSKHDERQSKKIRPQRFYAAAFQENAARDDAEMGDGIHQRERLQPVGHGFHGCERAGNRGQRRVDEETHQLRLLRGLSYRSDKSADANTAEYAQRAAGDDVQQIAAQRHAENEFEQDDGEEDHIHLQKENRRDFGDDDLRGAGRRHQQLLHRSGFAFLDHGGGGHQRAVQDEQDAEGARNDEPGADQARVEQEGRGERDLVCSLDRVAIRRRGRSSGCRWRVSLPRTAGRRRRCSH